jgi:SprT protein
MPLDLNQISKILREPPPQMVTKINKVVDECLEICQAKVAKELRRPRIDYDLRGNTSGHADSSHISINLDYLLDERYQEDFLNETLPHEVAHVVQCQVWPTSKSHGNEWKLIMRWLGKAPDRCHEYEPKPARKTKKYLYRCPCGDLFPAGANVHNKLQNGQVRTHSKCGSRITKAHFTGRVK